MMGLADIDPHVLLVVFFVAEAEAKAEARDWAGWAGCLVVGQAMAARTPVPGLGGLAALAIGAAGVRSRRHRVA